MWHANRPGRGSPQKGADGFVTMAWRFMASHPWTAMLTMTAVVAIVLVVAHMTKPEAPSSVAVQQTLPPGAAVPTVVAVKDEKSGCTVRLYYDGDRLVSVLPALRKGGEPDCPDA